MTWRLEINHVTRYNYDRPVVASYNEARVTPLSTPGQLVIDAQVAVQPTVELFCYRDYWGALVHCFDLHDPHDSLVVTARATVETGLTERPVNETSSSETSSSKTSSSETSSSKISSSKISSSKISSSETSLSKTSSSETSLSKIGTGLFEGPNGHAEPRSGGDGQSGRSASGQPGPEGTSGASDDGIGASWELVASPIVRDGFYEFLAPSRLVSVEELASVAAELCAGGPTPGQAVLAALEWAHGELEYVAGATHVHTSAVEAWRDGRGVCQDFAHLSLAVLRAMGIPARYVSGYFYPKASGEVGATVLGESHAWIEAWTGDWTGHDPTNLLPVAERYVVVARGRDYADVSPLRGIYSGPPGSCSEVTVELTRRA
jgi:transglutaminase-like putative cysteine protease